MTRLLIFYILLSMAVNAFSEPSTEDMSSLEELSYLLANDPTSDPTDLFLPTASGISDPTMVVTSITNEYTVMSLRTARFMFSLREKYWDDGTPVTVVLLPWDSYIHKSFVSNTLGVRPERLRRVIEERANSGRSHGFVMVNSLEEMVQVLKTTKGSIGYLTDYMLRRVDDEIIFIDVM